MMTIRARISAGFLAILLCAVALCVLTVARAQEADLSDLSPEQRRAVERMKQQGATPRAVQGAIPLTEPGPRAAIQRADDIPNGRILGVPTFAQRQAQGDLVPVNLVPTPGERAISPFVTFGQVFVPGMLFPGQGLILRAGDRVCPVQVDVKALNRDGSVRHAVLTADVSGLSQRGIARAMLARSERPVTGAVTAQDRTDIVVEVTGSRDDGGEFGGQVRLAELMAAPSGAPWLSGPMVREHSVSKPIGPLLNVRIDHRLYADGSTRSRMVFENHSTFAPGRRDMTYDAVILNNGNIAGEANGVRHYRGSNWSTVVRTGPRPAFLVQLHPGTLMQAQAVLPYDLGNGIAEGAILTNQASLARTKGPLQPGLLTQYFPSTGGRRELGTLPAWDVAWLKTQDPRAREVMLDMANVSGAVPWHFEDDETGQPVRIDRRPAFWADEGGTKEYIGRDRIPPAYFAGRDGGWTLDTAHKPLLTYTAYLVTGDAYFARELAHESAFAIAKVWPDLREGGAWVGEELQLRGRAWALRDAAAAAWLLPENHPLKDYFIKARDGTLAHMAEAYLGEGRLDGAGETEGWFEDTSYSVKGGVPPWQNDYMVITLAQEALRGSADAARLVQWAENYQVGRFLDTGAWPSLGAAYVHMLNDPATGEPFGSWQAMVQNTAPVEAYTENYPGYGAGYVTSAYAALVMTHYVTGSRRSVEALNALYRTQSNSRLFDPTHRNSIHVLPGFLLQLPNPESP